jgi:hypothetical protein
MAPGPTLEEIIATVGRMEERYRQAALFADYQRLCSRFDADLSDQRDRALARSAALMLISYAEESTRRTSD